MTLPVVGWREVVRALSRIGFRVVRQRGSHIIMRNDGRLVSVPHHDELDRGTLLEVLDQAGLTKQQFLELL
jgi:predicted RNA binding protein YcfA (HicA-like mRNA interferase family)